MFSVNKLNKLELFGRFWYSYNDMLDERPIFVKSMTSLFGFALGDILAQLIGGTSYNLFRTLRMTLFGIFMDGPVGTYILSGGNQLVKAPQGEIT